MSTLQPAVWDDDPHSIAEQHTVTDGRNQRWLPQRKKKNPMVSAELLRLFKKPTAKEVKDLDRLLPKTFVRTFRIS